MTFWGSQARETPTPLERGQDSGILTERGITPPALSLRAFDLNAKQRCRFVGALFTRSLLDGLRSRRIRRDPALFALGFGLCLEHFSEPLFCAHETSAHANEAKATVHHPLVNCGWCCSLAARRRDEVGKLRARQQARNQADCWRRARHFGGPLDGIGQSHPNSDRVARRADECD